MAHSEIYGPQYKGGALLCWLLFNRWHEFEFHLCVNMTRYKPFMENDWMCNQHPLRKSFPLLFFFLNEILLVKKAFSLPWEEISINWLPTFPPHIKDRPHFNSNPDVLFATVRNHGYDGKICLSCLKLLRTLRALLSKCWFDYQYFNLRKRNTAAAWKLSRLTWENLRWRVP